MDTKGFAEFLKEMRTKKGLTQQELADYLSVTDKAVSKWERGLSMPDITLIGTLAAVLGVSIQELFNMQLKNVSSSNSAKECGCRDIDKSDCNDGRVELQTSGKTVSPLLFGNNLEHTRKSIYGGLSAELIKNRKFCGKPLQSGRAAEWYGIGERVYYSFTNPYTKHIEPEKMRRMNEGWAQSVYNIYNMPDCGIGQHRIYIGQGKGYTFELVAKAAQDTQLNVSIASADSAVCCFSAVLNIKKGEWQSFKCAFTAENGCKNADLRMTFSGGGTVTFGAVSLMPDDNFHGMRRDVIENLKETGVTVLRWPGGNFAGEYRWKDGLLPRNERMPLQAYTEIETQPYSNGYDFHEINTDDFIALCREIGALPFITINPAWDSPEDCAKWVEYCNGDETTEYGRKRTERGFKEPYNVTLWGLGNEFGYGHMEGMNTPFDYSTVVRKCAEAMKKTGSKITFVSSGCYPSEDWFKYSAIPLSDTAAAFSFHNYGRYMGGNEGGADNFSDFETLKMRYNGMLGHIETVEYMMREMQPYISDKIKICFDEWNAWEAWYRESGVADAMYAAKMLNMMMEKADELNLFCACYFELINEGGIKVGAESSSLTPVGKVFSIMKNHLNGRICCADYRRGIMATEKGEIITMTLLNENLDAPKSFSFKKQGKQAKITVYTSESVMPFSDFEEKTVTAVECGDMYTVNVPPHSIATVRIY